MSFRRITVLACFIVPAAVFAQGTLRTTSAMNDRQAPEDVRAMVADTPTHGDTSKPDTTKHDTTAHDSTAPKKGLSTK